MAACATSSTVAALVVDHAEETQHEARGAAEDKGREEDNARRRRYNRPLVVRCGRASERVSDGAPEAGEDEEEGLAARERACHTRGGAASSTCAEPTSESGWAGVASETQAGGAWRVAGRRS